MWGRIGVGVCVSLIVASTPNAAPGARATGRNQRAPSAAAAPATRALDRPAFTATPDELLALARAAPTGDWSSVVLREQREISYDDRGRATRRWRTVYVVQTEDADDDGVVDADWHASYQDRPVIRARVIAPDGRVAELDPAKVTEPTLSGASPAGDHRYLSAPLPDLPIGAVVEWEIATVDREPAPGGSVERVEIGDSMPVSSTVISYAAPAGRPARIRIIERDLPRGIRAQHRVANGRETWRYEIPALPAQRYETGVPGDVVVIPYVGAATAASWEVVVRGHRRRIEERIAEAPFELPAGLPRTASIEALELIVAWVHRHVEFTGEAEAAAAPAPPAETVKRGKGSGSDLAALLIALLRQAGIRAELVLVDTDRYRRVDPDLPGLGGFGLAAVRARVGGRDVWIDPAEDLMRPGQLPDRTQGRRALVIADDTRALSMTPLASPADNTVHEVRTFIAAEHGPARATQVVRSTGAFEAEDRSWVRMVGRAELDKGFGRQAEELFSGTLEHATSTDPEDLTRPFELTLTVKDARRMFTSREQVEIILYPHAALAQLPTAVSAAPDAPRTHDFVWSQPQIYEIEHRIVLPPGFTPPAAAPERVRQLGTATFTERQKVDGQTLIVTYRFDSGKPRLTPSELATLQAAVQDLQAETVHLKIDHTSAVLAEAGKLREAIAECQRLIGMHPGEPLHHDQLVSVLLRAGAGEAARREARRAVAVGPSDADAAAVLGWALTFDSFGRQYTYDWDRAGAIAALQQARKLNPQHFGAHVELARVLVRAGSGSPFGDGADLRGAAEAWRAAIAIERTDENVLALAEVLVWSGQFAEAERVARGVEPTIDRDQLIVTAIAGSGGASAAIAAASDLRSGVERNQLLAGAAWIMLYQRRYDAATALFAESGAPATMPPWLAADVTKLTKHPAIPTGASEPRAAVLDVLAAALDPARKTPAFWDAQLERTFRGSPERLIPAALRTPQMVPLFGDIAQSAFTIDIAGGAGVWRATVDDGRRFQLYFVLDHGVVKLLATSGLFGAVGRYVLRGDASADPRMRVLLDWVRADGDRSPASNVLAFQKWWGQGMPSSHDAIQLAAAALTGGSDADRVIAVAKRCASPLPDAELNCHDLLATSYAASERWAEAAEQIDAIVQAQPQRAPGYAGQHAWALAKAGRFEDAELVLDGILARYPGDHDAIVSRFGIANLRGSLAEALQRADAIAMHPQATPDELNDVAWYRLVHGADLPVAGAIARRAAGRSPRSHAVANTLAAIEAELGELGDAITDNAKAMGLHGAAPMDADWYVAGRIYEQLGLTADAVAAYRRIARPGAGTLSAARLANDRLRALRATH